MATTDDGQGTPGTPYRVLVVDDDPVQRLLVAEILEPPAYRVDAAGDADEALARLPGDYDVVLLDRDLPHVSGDALCRRLREQHDRARLPIVMVTGSGGAADIAACLRAGANDLVRKPYHPLELVARVESAVQHKRLTDRLDHGDALLFAIARMVEAKDLGTGEHCARLAHAAAVLGQALGLAPAEQETLRRAAVLHDIGKLGVPDAVLAKPGPLTEEERLLLRQHPLLGARLLEGLHSLQAVVPIVRHHHEHWDGSGYPFGLAGEAIPRLARVFRVADRYDAMVQGRPYRAPLGPDEALERLQAETRRGLHDPQVVQTFVELVRRTPQALAAPADRGGLPGQTLYEHLAS